jgi:hypothetical protein
VAMAKAPAKKAKKKVTTKKAIAKKVTKKPAAKKVVKRKVATKKVVAKKAAIKKTTKKVVAKKAVKKIATKKTPAKRVVVKKVQAKKATKPNYLKLPFEVYYKRLGIKIYELVSDVKPTKFSDIKATKMSMGDAFGLRFLCDMNNGGELCCAMENDHGLAVPGWLSLLNEENADFNWGETYKVEIRNKKIIFTEPSEEESDEWLEEAENYGYIGEAFGAYLFDDNQEPDYLILDASGSRIKINADGYQIDEQGNQVGSKKVLDLYKITERGDYETTDFDTLRAEWIAGLVKKFPNDKGLSFDMSSK